MKKRFTEVVEMIDFNELVNMKRDIDKGGMEINQVLTQKIKEELKKHNVYCSICNAKIDPYSTSNFTLIFGPEDLKKKATFCALDCMEYFLKNLKDLRRDWKNAKKEKNKTAGSASGMHEPDFDSDDID
ncbi:hypothetical protein COV19_07480 [Candidatus Woesearchaeota archaeon CG10_big_fil_rev_8_21_14_0_10_44_13]|nr:MAG: hypothetical protein COV19_07480 [Candidatus Woesearchaeota archaeon CG10_big_fil_rev_8_21_14_0_10_44_13]